MAGLFGNRRTLTIIHAAVCGGLLTLAASSGNVVANPADGAATDDWELTLRAKIALLDDSTYRKLNLAVVVRKGVASLHGPVPSTAVAEQAVARLRKVPGVRDVINETYVPLPDEPLAKSMPHPVTTQRPSVPSDSTVPAPTPPNPVAVPPALPHLSVSPAPTVGRPAEASLPPVAAPVRQTSLAELIEERRLRDRRFQNIRVEVREGWVLLRGTVSRPQDAWEFVELVSELPGVTNVSQRVTTAGR